jgi:hypothetical protein
MKLASGLFVIGSVCVVRVDKMSVGQMLIDQVTWNTFTYDAEEARWMAPRILSENICPNDA